jgi:shikimate kinase/3-dehydroquinate synthase
MLMQNVFFIGLSGSGKSTVGRLLAERLGRPFVDTDLLVEEACGRHIAAIFAEEGEAYFRACERRALEQAAATAGGAIIATGGGAVLVPENRRLMAERGRTVFLAVQPETALRRLQQQRQEALAAGDSPEVRPLLAGPDPLAALRGLLAARQALYEQADIICPTDGRSPEEVARLALAALIARGALGGEEVLIQHVRAGEGYDAVVDWGGLGRLPQYLARLALPQRVFVVSDHRVHALYGSALLRTLAEGGFEAADYVVPAGEASKSLEQLSALYDWLIEQRAERREALIALGGGMVGDLVGFAAATYLRGVPLVQVPTSLLAQVDAAIGGKTGINHARGKNLIGAFYQPRLVLADPATLLTMPERERIEGWAEVVKYGMILDAELFALLEANAATLRDFARPPASLLTQIIARCIALKAAVIEEDEREQGQRAILNYGHTLGHALENVAGYGEWLHGEAVALGMVAAAELACQAGLFSRAEAERQRRLLAALGLPTVYRGSVSAAALLEAIQRDKKVAARRVRWIMPRAIGEVRLTPLPDELVRQVVTTFFARKDAEAQL